MNHSYLVFKLRNGKTKTVRHDRHFELSAGDVIADMEGRIFVVSKERTTGHRQTVWLDQTNHR